LGFSRGADQPQSWQALGSAFAPEPAAPSLSGCTVVKEEREGTGGRRLGLGAADLPGVLLTLV